MLNKYMQYALELAQKGKYTTSPNPNVGCVIVKHDVIIGTGYHSRVGHLHAESYALKMAGNSAEGADLYVNLEPCCHFGANPPCVENIIKHKLNKVFIGMDDPYPQVCGQGIKQLSQSGIEVVTNCMYEEASYINRGFISRLVHNRPWVTLCMVKDYELHQIQHTVLFQDLLLLKAENDVILTDDSMINHVLDLKHLNQPIIKEVPHTLCTTKTDIVQLSQQMNIIKPINYALIIVADDFAEHLIHENLINEIVIYSKSSSSVEQSYSPLMKYAPWNVFSIQEFATYTRVNLTKDTLITPYHN